MEALTVDDLCTAKDWTVVPSQSYPRSMHPAAFAHMFSTTYDMLFMVEIEPYARPCCSLVPKCPEVLRRLWKGRHAVPGKRVHACEDMLKRLNLGEVTFEDMLHAISLP